ncbi:MAG: N-acetylglucosaminyl-phosphatidylinositol de-N-acetylase [Sporothrix epigloea]
MDLLPMLGVLAVLIPILYMYTAAVVTSRFPALRNKRICLLIAHPDDEAMFFAPSVLALTRPESGNHVKILCLSTGNAAGLGETRKRELVKSAMALGLRDEDDVFVLDSPDFPDSMTTEWDSQVIATLLAKAFTPGAAAHAASRSDEPVAATIDVLLTFDGQGVSGHPNHISLYRGARRFVAALVQGKPGWRAPVDLYTLTSVPLLRKYAGAFDLLPTLTAWSWQLRAAPRGATATTKAIAKDHPTALVFLAGLNPSAAGGGLGAAWHAMTTAHQSQMVWFRYGWIALSRYMVINDLRLETNFGSVDSKKP